MANSLDWNVCYYGKDFLSYLLVVSYGSMSAWRVTRIIPKANNDMTQVNLGKIMLKYRKLPLIISSPTPEIRSTPLPNPLRRRGGYSGFPGMIEWATSSPGRFSLSGTWLSNRGTKPPKNLKGFQPNPKKSLDQKLASKNPVPNFQTLKICRKN